jgi:hypothetical protein
MISASRREGVSGFYANSLVSLNILCDEGCILFNRKIFFIAVVGTIVLKEKRL